MVRNDSQQRAIKRQHTRRLIKLVGRLYYLKQRGRKADMYNLICSEFVDLGGVYVKFLQGVLLNTKVMREWKDADKYKIFEDLKTVPIDIVQLLRRELAPDDLQQIALIQPEPFAAGSFGQVYLGQHQNGKKIIVKVLRPQVSDLLKHDLKLIGLFTRIFVKYHYENVDVKISDAIREFREATLRETDYVAEASFARELFEAYKDHPKLVIPETYLELSTKHIIVQDYLEGISAVDLLRLREQQVDPKEYIASQLGSDLNEQLTTLGVESLMGAFTLPRIQGDPHPGNIRLLPENKVGMIDFGIVAHAPRNKAAFFGVLDEWNRLMQDGQNIVGLFEQFMRFFVSDLYNALKKLSSLSPGTGGGNNQLTREVGRIMQGVVDSILGKRDLETIIEDGQTLKLFTNIVNKGNRFGLVVRLEASEILRAAQTYTSLVEALGQRKAVLPRVFSEVVERVEAAYPGLRDQADDPISISHAIEIVNNWLERVAMRDPQLFRQLINIVKKSAPRNQAPAEQANA